MVGEAPPGSGGSEGSPLMQGRYRLEAKLASGGMGTVFSAVDERLQRRVAVKLLRDDLARDPKFVERFRREARSVAALAHPNIASVFDYGEEEGRHFIVMELAEGRDLARVLREEGKLGPDRAVRIAEQICDALGHAHAAGVIHRDIKPANVIVGEQDLVKVTDFGIARAAGDSTITATGSVLGSAHYISPEQANGVPATPASDVYSLGIVLYEMLTGALPFTGDSPVGVAMRHLTDHVPAPSVLNPHVSPEIDAIVAGATARAPSERFRDAAAMAVALQGSLGGIQTEPIAPETLVSTPGGIGGGAAQTVWPIPGDRWDPNRIGKLVAIVFGALLVTALALLVVRITTHDPPARARGSAGSRAAGAGRAGTVSPASASPSTVTLPELVDESFTDAEKFLKEAGFVVDRNDQAAEGVEKDVVLAMNPPAGSAVAPGGTITLTVSTGEEDTKPVPPGHGGKVPPGHAKKDKHKEKDD